ncbi:hypothetical protein JI739_01180 [Ramlibacter sp. AW1]|uniref:Uncharacterized protein n=1 Tax=Ramlibacter aurantiacus TaxID=2801330 RepID=A0A936ZMK4_9BURK|nr:DUF6152 family protein [Ramlibacter aurantiacus]MBL0418946.1 hypothetical protein [Ramlibacter aurantiacus]
MQRRSFVFAGLGLPTLAFAHHGWSSFDQERPIWLEGRVTRVRWQNPHAELELEPPRDLRVPPDLPTRSLPSQSAPVDGKSLLARATVPTRSRPRWTVELAPLTRMRAWNVKEIQVGDTIGVLGFTFKQEQGDPLLRAEYLFVDGRAYGLRSSPA